MKEIDFEKRLRFMGQKNIAHFVGQRSREGHWIIEEASSGLIFTVDSYGRNVSTLEKIVENVPGKITRWVNFYKDGYPGRAHHTKDAADNECDDDRIACVPITFEPGEGL